METTARARKMAWLMGLAAIVVLAVATWQAWPHIRLRYLFEPLGNNAKALPEYRHRRTGMIFVLVPGGTFSMGSPESEAGRQLDEGPVHKVTLSPFLMAKFEVTQAQWKGVMGSNPSSGFEGNNLPVDSVSWNDCQAFCKKTGLKLPTEAQWEFACRAGTGGPFAGTGKLEDMGWYIKNSGMRAHRVRRKLPNDFGLHDMHGNVLEWCQDLYAASFYEKPEARRKDPVCTWGSEERVLRGGSWFLDPACCRSAFRGRLEPGFRDGYLGFRLGFPLP